MVKEKKNFSVAIRYEITCMRGGKGEGGQTVVRKQSSPGFLLPNFTEPEKKITLYVETQLKTPTEISHYSKD